MLCTICIAFCCVAAPDAPLFAINEDNSHYYFTRTLADMNKASLEAWVDQYADTGVTHLFLNPNAMRASYKSAVWDTIWECGEQTPPEPGSGDENWLNNAKALHDAGLDPYAVWIQRCHERGISPWLSMRMNDVHCVDNPKHCYHSSFWAKHPEFRRDAANAGSWTAQALDYGHPEVREFAMLYVKELFERYDADGIELDWMRFGWHFKSGEEAAGRELLNEFMRQTRELAKEWSVKRGHPVLVGARVPAHPDAAAGLGMDGVAWAREGLVDMLVPTPFWAATDFDIPVELWKERIGADALAKVKILPGCENLLRAWPGGEALTNDLASARGFAAAHLQRGADGIYYFNYMDSDTTLLGGPGVYRAFIEGGLSPTFLQTQSLRYPIAYRDTVPSGFDAQVRLPATGATAFDIYTGPAGSAQAYVRLGFAETIPTDAPALEIRVHGASCVPADPVPAFDSPIPGAKETRVFAIPEDTIKPGYNHIEIGPATLPSQLIWTEIAQFPNK